MTVGLLVALHSPSTAREEPEPGIWACFRRPSAAALGGGYQTRLRVTKYGDYHAKYGGGGGGGSSSKVVLVYQGVDDNGGPKKATGKAVHPWDPRPITERLKMDDFIAAPLHFVHSLVATMQVLLFVYNEVTDEWMSQGSIICIIAISNRQEITCLTLLYGVDC